MGRDARRADPPRPAETLYQLFRTGTRCIRPDGPKSAASGADRHGCCGSAPSTGSTASTPRTTVSSAIGEPGAGSLPNDTYNNLVNALYIPENTPTCCTSKFQRPGRRSTSGIRAAARHPPRGRRRTYGQRHKEHSATTRTCCSQRPTGSRSTTPAACRASAYYSCCPTRRRCPTTRCARFSATGRTSSGSAPTADWPNSTSNARRSTASADQRQERGRTQSHRQRDLLEPLTTACGSPRTKASCGTTARDATRDTRVTWPTKGFAQHRQAAYPRQPRHPVAGNQRRIDYYDAARDRFVRAEHSNQNFSLKYIYDIRRTPTTTS